MMLEAAMDWEPAAGVESEFDKLRRLEPDAIEAFVARYQHRLFRYLVRLVHEPAAAEDLLQQTWVQVLAKIRRYDARRSFEPWLFSIAHNLAIDHVRRRAPESLSEPEGAEEPPACGPDALDRLLAWERAERVAAALATLPPFYREALSLRFEEEMSLEEIAEVTHSPLPTVKSRLRRGLEALRKKLGAENVRA